MRYRQQRDGDKVFVPTGQPWRQACCDCGLVHDFSLTRKRGGIEVGIQRNRRATAQRRRKLKASGRLKVGTVTKV